MKTTPFAIALVALGLLAGCKDSGTSNNSDTGSTDVPGVSDLARLTDTPSSRDVGPASGDLGSTSCPRPDSGAQYPFYCGRGYIGDICEDVISPPLCIGGAWSCGTAADGHPWPRQDQCTCFGLPPSTANARCTCVDKKWQCTTDAGATDARDAAASDVAASDVPVSDVAVSDVAADSSATSQD